MNNIGRPLSGTTDPCMLDAVGGCKVVSQVEQLSKYQPDTAQRFYCEQTPI